MSDGNTAAGLLSDLQKLDEAGRDRILNLLPPENVKDIVKACLRERERTSNSAASQHQPHGVVHREATQPADVAYAVEVTTRQDGNPPKRAISELAPRQCKQPRIEPDPQGQQIADAGEENDKSKDLGKNGLPKVLPKECSVQERSVDKNDETGPIKPQEMQQKPLQMGLFLGERDGTSLYWKISTLPYDVQTELIRRFDVMWSANEHTRTQYIKYTQEPQKYISKYQCLHTMITQGHYADGSIPQEAKKPGMHADSECIAAGYPCGRFRGQKDKSGFGICFFPLPEDLRQGRSWEELGYWVLPEVNATGVTTAR